jgi:hypothetical protein
MYCMAIRAATPSFVWVHISISILNLQRIRCQLGFILYYSFKWTLGDNCNFWSLELTSQYLLNLDNPSAQDRGCLNLWIEKRFLIKLKSSEQWSPEDSQLLACALCWMSTVPWKCCSCENLVFSTLFKCRSVQYQEEFTYWRYVNILMKWLYYLHVL